MARVPYVTKDDLSAEYEAYLEYKGEELNILAAIGNNPELLVSFLQFLNGVYVSAGLTARERELVILTVASSIESEYEWHQHVGYARDEYGFTEEEILGLVRGDRTPFSEKERALIAYTRGIARGGVEDPLHEEITEHYDVETIIGIVFIATQYVGVGLLLDTLGVEIEKGKRFVGWDLEGARGPPRESEHMGD